jgi:disulfide bond formation protein DsbB
MKLPVSRRLGFIAIFLACAAMLAFALYLQYYKYLNPCPMCIFQRVCVLAAGIVALLGAIHNPKSDMGGRIYGFLTVLSVAIGFGIAARHTYIQYYPPADPVSCGAGLNMMLQTQPFLHVLKVVLYGTGECAQIDWTLLGLSLPGWAAIGFAGLIAFSLWVTLAGRRR